VTIKISIVWMVFQLLNSLPSGASSDISEYATPAWARSHLSFCCWAVYYWHSSIRCSTDSLSDWHYWQDSSSWTLILLRNTPIEMWPVFSW
jgi:hypothetical protein